jgi:signal transduction histidine kinase
MAVDARLLQNWMLGAARHLLALINDILDLSEIEARRMEASPRKISPVIQDVVKTIGPMATKNGNRLVIDFPSDLGTIHADQTRFPAIRTVLGARGGAIPPRDFALLGAEQVLRDARGGEDVVTRCLELLTQAIEVDIK